MYKRQALDSSDGGPSLREVDPAIYLKPKRGRVIAVEAGQTIGVVGSHAREYSMWVAAQLEVQGVTSSISDVGNQSDVSNRSVRIWAAESIEELGVDTSLVLRSCAVGGALWSDEVSRLLASRSGGNLPNHVGFDSLYGSPSSAEIQRRWSRAEPGALVLGKDSNASVFSADLIREGPHALVVGGTGSGKSEFLTTLIFALATNYSPRRLRVLLIDYKGGAGLLHAAKLPHTERLVTDLDGMQTPWLLRVLSAEISNRKTLLLGAGYRSLTEWSEDTDPSSTITPPPLLIVVADEVRILADNSPELLKQLALIATQGRSLGIHLVAATQRPGGAVTADMRAVLDLRIALRCSEGLDSIDSIGSRDAADLPRVAGRAIVASAGGLMTIQSALVENPDEWVKEFGLAGRNGQNRRLLPDPLPESIPDGELRSVHTSAIGLYEDSRTSEVKPLIWDGRPMLLITASSLRQEAARIAFCLASTGSESSRSSDRPAYQTRTTGRVVWAGTISPKGAPLGVTYGDVLRLLEEVVFSVGEYQKDASSSREPISIIIPDFRGMERNLQTSLGSLQTEQYLRALLECAERSGLRLICIDTAPDSRSDRFPWRLYRFSSPEQITAPRMAAHVPDSIGGQRARPAQVVSAIRGRVVVTDPNGTNYYAQLQDGTSVDFRNAIQPTALDAARTELGIITGTNSTPSLTVVSDDPSHVDQVVATLGGPERVSNVEYVEPGFWTRLSSLGRSTIVVIEPSREIARLLTAQAGLHSAWVMASLPFPERCGLVCHGTKIGTLVLEADRDRDR